MFIKVHPIHPQKRLIALVADTFRKNGIISYPTDSGYAVGCALENKSGIDRIRDIRKVKHNHNFTLICKDLSEIGSYAIVGNYAYRILKTNTPGPFTFILKATRVVPRRLYHPKRRTIGVRIPKNPIPLAIASALGEPFMSVSLSLPDDNHPLTEPEDIMENLGHSLDLVVAAGFCSVDPTTIVDLTGDEPILVRAGKNVKAIFPD